MVFCQCLIWVDCIYKLFWGKKFFWSRQAENDVGEKDDDLLFDRITLKVEYLVRDKWEVTCWVCNIPWTTDYPHQRVKYQSVSRSSINQQQHVYIAL
jgi:hypothetical protein